MTDKLYIAVKDNFPDYMTPTLVAHSVIAAHELFKNQDKTEQSYMMWYDSSFKKCVVSVNDKEWNKIIELEDVYLGHEIHTNGGEKSCAVICPREVTPNVLKFAKLWSPKV